MTEGVQGRNRFYTGNVPVGELDRMVKFADELPELDDEEKRMQRSIAKSRIKLLVNYLIDAPDHFFSAVTLIILPRELDRPAVKMDPEEEDGDYAFQAVDSGRPGKNRLGLLYLSGDVVLFPGDGQHRLKAEFEAIKEKPELAKEELPVVIIPFESYDQVRQLFSDLNLNAKVISKSVGYDFETRDPIVLVAKGVSQRVPLFDGRVNRVTNSLPGTSNNVITLGTLVPASRSIAKGLAEREEISVEQYLDDRPRAEEEISSAWETIIEAFEPRWEQAVGEQHVTTPGQLREEFVFPHGLGWRALAEAAAQLIVRRGPDRWESSFSRAVGSLDWGREAEIWDGTAVIHDPDSGKNRVNNTGPAVRELAKVVVDRAESL